MTRRARRPCARPRTWARRVPAGLVLVAAVALIGACAEPPLADGPPEPEGADAPVELTQDDPAHDALVAEVEDLADTIAAARDHLAAARDADRLPAAQAAGRDALALLLADAGSTTASTSVFPAESAERGDAGEGDGRLMSTLVLAREAGSFGREVAHALGQQVAGDLGAWQRDAAGMVDLVHSTARPHAPLGDLEAAVLDLSGDGTRALAWTVLVTEAGSVDDAAAYAERGMAHLDLVLAALDLLLDADGEPG